MLYNKEYNKLKDKEKNKIQMILVNNYKMIEIIDKIQFIQIFRNLKQHKSYANFKVYQIIKIYIPLI
jgi:hypothetical protein